MTEWNFGTDNDITLPAAGVSLNGFLNLPQKPQGLVVFVHGSGSSRFSSRNQAVAHYLNQQNLGTLLFDLLTPEENETDQYTRQYRFDIPRLSERLVGVVDWLKQQEDLKQLAVGLFGASTGAAAALIAAAQRPVEVAAVVSRGGRPDLADVYLDKVQAPTLLIVGGYDDQVIQLNQQVADQLRCHNRLEIIPGATHLFEEPGKLETVSELAGEWFTQYLVAS